MEIVRGESNHRLRVWRGPVFRSSRSGPSPLAIPHPEGRLAFPPRRKAVYCLPRAVRGPNPGGFRPFRWSLVRILRIGATENSVTVLVTPGAPQEQFRTKCPRGFTNCEHLTPLALARSEWQNPHDILPCHARLAVGRPSSHCSLRPGAHAPRSAEQALRAPPGGSCRSLQTPVVVGWS